MEKTALGKDGILFLNIGMKEKAFSDKVVDEIEYGNRERLTQRRDIRDSSLVLSGITTKNNSGISGTDPSVVRICDTIRLLPGLTKQPNMPLEKFDLGGTGPTWHVDFGVPG